jgi:hypothetical protein
MLLMVLAKATIIRAPVMGRGIKFKRHFAALGVIAAVFVVFNISSYQYLFAAMLRAQLEHINFIVLENDLGINPF